jgi:sarcosine oxidase
MAFDFVVIGLGAAGSATLGALARSGARVAGIDRFAPPHDQGSSHGETRLLRVAYAEGAQYVPMARRAIELWRDLEARTGAELLRQTGVVYAGPHTSPFLSASLSSAHTYGVCVDTLTDAARREHAPALRIADDWLCCAEREGGYLLAERAIATLLEDAAQSGAEVMRNARCRAIEPDANGVRIVTDAGEVHADRCVVAAGAWTAELLPALAPYIHVERKTLHWFADPQASYRPATFRPFLIDDENGHQFYGFPDCGTGVKVAEHTAPSAAYAHAGDAVRDITPADIETIGALAARHMPGLGERLRSVTCLYPMSKDGHFIMDAYPESERIFVAAGLSGHGFKFAPVIGEAMANLAMGAEQKIDIAPFSLRRF